MLSSHPSALGQPIGNVGRIDHFAGFAIAQRFDAVDAEAAAAIAEQSRPGIDDLNAAIGEIAIASCELGVVRNRYRRDLAVNFAHLPAGTVALCHQPSIGARRFFIERNDGTAANLKGPPCRDRRADPLSGDRQAWLPDRNTTPP